MRAREVNRRLLLFAARTVAAARRLSHPRVLGPTLLRGIRAGPRATLRGVLMSIRLAARGVLRLVRLLAQLLIWLPVWIGRRGGRTMAEAYRQIDFDGFRRSALLACAVAGAGLLIAADFSPVRKVIVLTVTRDEIRGGPQHLYALAVLGVVALPLAWGAASGRSRPAMRGLVVIGMLALGVALAVDLPRLSHTEGLGALYDDVDGSPAIGFARELGGALLLVAAGTVLLRLSPPARQRKRTAERRDMAVDPSPTAPAQYSTSTRGSAGASCR